MLSSENPQGWIFTTVSGNMSPCLTILKVLSFFPFINLVCLMFQDDFDGPSVKWLKDVGVFLILGRPNLDTAHCKQVRT